MLIAPFSTVDLEALHHACRAVSLDFAVHVSETVMHRDERVYRGDFAFVAVEAAGVMIDHEPVVGRRGLPDVNAAARRLLDRLPQPAVSS